MDYFPYNFCPKEFLPADGRVVAIAEYQGLFSLLGTTYGGDGKTNFALPNLEKLPTKTGAELKPCIARYGIYPTRD